MIYQDIKEKIRGHQDRNHNQAPLPHLIMSGEVDCHFWRRSGVAILLVLWRSRSTMSPDSSSS